MHSPPFSTPRPGCIFHIIPSTMPRLFRRSRNCRANYRTSRQLAPALGPYWGASSGGFRSIQWMVAIILAAPGLAAHGAKVDFNHDIRPVIGSEEHTSELQSLAY